MMKPDAALARRMTAEVADRLSMAMGHLVVDILGKPPVEVMDPSPAAFGLQGMMRDRALADDRAGLADLHDRLGSVLTGTTGPDGLVRPLSAPWFGAAEIEILQAGFADDIGLTARLDALPPDVSEEASDTIHAVLTCMASEAPDWHDEFRALVHQVVLASSPGDRQTYAGASAFDLWGAILVNPSYQRGPLHLAMTLVHESSHLKLFHAYLDDEIVLNDPDERFSSPLRRQPRPMNGLYHAAFVLARMAAFATAMMRARTASDVFGEGWREQFQSEAQSAVASFDSAYDLISRQGRLTPKGSALIREAAEAVQEARQIALAA
jgi:hypothetical protein